VEAAETEPEKKEEIEVIEVVEAAETEPEKKEETEVIEQ